MQRRVCLMSCQACNSLERDRKQSDNQPKRTHTPLKVPLLVLTVPVLSLLLYLLEVPVHLTLRALTGYDTRNPPVCSIHLVILARPTPVCIMCRPNIPTRKAPPNDERFPRVPDRHGAEDRDCVSAPLSGCLIVSYTNLYHPPSHLLALCRWRGERD